MTNFRASTVCAALLCLAGSAASAQSAAPAAGSDATIPEKAPPATAPATDLDTRSGSLSEKLSTTNGVIAPSGDVDPGMHVPAPQTGATPVIKPGTTGGDTAK